MTILSVAVVVVGYEKLSSTFRLCPSLHWELDYRHMLGWLRNAFTVLAMMDYPYPTHFLAPLPANPVNVSCCRTVLSETCFSRSCFMWPHCCKTK